MFYAERTALGCQIAHILRLFTPNKKVLNIIIDTHGNSPRMLTPLLFLQQYSSYSKPDFWNY